MKKILLFVTLSAALISCKKEQEIEAVPADQEKVVQTDATAQSAETPETPEATEATETPEAAEAAETEKIEVKENTSKTPTVSYAKFGAPVAATNVLTKEQMLQKYAKLKKGDTIQVKFRSKIGSVCKKKGCWMKMDLASGKESFIRFKDYGFFVPLNADGSTAIVSGKAFIDVVSVDELKHYEKDAGKSQAEIDKITEPKITYAFTADGVLIEE